MKTLLLISVSTLAVIGCGVASAQDVSGNVTLASEYIFRGITQTANDPAIQGGFDAAFDNFYVGTWASNVEFGDGTTIEVDVYGGFTASAGGFDLDFGGIYYTYPGSPDGGGEQDFVEGYAGVSRDFGGVGLDAKLSYSPDFYLESGPAIYAEFGAAIPLSDDISIDARVAASRFDDAPAADYEDYQIGASTSAFGVDWDLRLHDSSMADSRVVLSVSKTIGG
jgi:uncharacterized protein (TIGR02001 family)